MKNSVILLLVLCLVLGSCVSFSKRMIKDDLTVIKKSNVNLIEGKYDSEGYEHINSSLNKSEKAEGFSKMLLRYGMKQQLTVSFSKSLFIMKSEC